MKTLKMIFCFAAIILSACNKETQNTNQDFELSLKKLETKYSVHKNRYTKKQWMEISLHDGVGAIHGAEMGVVAGPWGIFCGALSVGLFCSFIGHGSVPRPQDPMEAEIAGNNIGNTHNTQLTIMLTDFTYYSNPINAKSYCSSLITNSPINTAKILNEVNTNTTWEEAVLALPEGYYKSALMAFENTIFNLNNNQISAYYTDYSEMVQNSTLDNITKNKLLCVTGILAGSVKYHKQIEK